MTAAGKMKAEALAIFDGPECPQETRDVIEWFHASMLVQQIQPIGSPYPLRRKETSHEVHADRPSVVAVDFWPAPIRRRLG